MATPKLTGFIIALVLFSFFIGIFGTYFSAINDKYTVNYDNTSLTVYNKLNKLDDNIATYKTEITDVDADRNWLEKAVDAISAFFARGVTTVKTILGSFDVFNDMSKEAERELGERTGIGNTATSIRILVGAIVTVLLFIGVLLPIILRSMGTL